jgi:hypothetical protein
VSHPGFSKAGGGAGACSCKSAFPGQFDDWVGSGGVGRPEVGLVERLDPSCEARDTLHPLPPLPAEIVKPIGRIAGEKEVEEGGFTSAPPVDDGLAGNCRGEGPAEGCREVVLPLSGRPAGTKRGQKLDLYIL